MHLPNASKDDHRGTIPRFAIAALMPTFTRKSASFYEDASVVDSHNFRPEGTKQDSM